jgi:hypothetical protein
MTERVFLVNLAYWDSSVLFWDTRQHPVFEPIDTVVLYICKTKSRLQRRHCDLARHFKTDPTETVPLCFGYAKTLFWQRRHYGLARHFKTDPTKTVALCFGYAKTLCWRADDKADEQDISQLARWRRYESTVRACFRRKEATLKKIHLRQELWRYYFHSLVWSVLMTS